MSFDTLYQNTGLSEGQGLRPYNPKSVTKHKAPIGGCRSTPLLPATLSNPIAKAHGHPQGVYKCAIIANQALRRSLKGGFALSIAESW